MKIQEYMQEHNLTYKQVYDRIQKAEIPAIKKGNTWVIPSNVAPVQKDTASRSLRDLLTIAQTEKIKQQLEEGRQEIERNFAGEVARCLVGVLKPFSDVMQSLNLSKEETQKIADYLNNAINKLEMENNHV